MRHLDVNAHDCTPKALHCPVHSDVVEVQGLDIPEEKKHHDDF